MEVTPMDKMKLGAVEMRFADIIWYNAPVSSGDLVKLADTYLKWKKSTTYTVVKKLCDRGIFQNVKGSVTCLVTKEEFLAMQSEKLVEESFEGSFPSFLAAFVSRKKLSRAELQEIRDMIDSMEEE